MRHVAFAMLLLAAATADAGELPGTRLRPSSEVLTVLRVRNIADLMLTDEIDVAKLAEALSTQEIRRTKDTSRIRPNEQVYFAATEQFRVLRLSIERDANAANATPHTLYLTPAFFSNLTLGQLEQTFGAGRLVLGPATNTRTWIHGPLDKRFVAHIIGDFAETPTPRSLVVNLQIRVDRR